MDVEASKTGGSPHARRLQWTWVLIGVAVSAVLMGTLVSVVEAQPPRPDVAILVAMLTFALMGMLVGFHSPERTVLEAAVAGGVVAVATPVVLRLAFDFALPPATTTSSAFAGIALAGAGGWVGEVMQGTIADGDRGSFQWVWVGVGTLLGVMLSLYSVFVLNALFELTALETLLWFLASFFVTAFAVAFFSPGSTILEPAAAAALVIVADAVLALAGFHAPFPILAVVIGIGLAFVAALIGGYAGEVAHNLHHRTAWGGVRRGVEVPKPERG